MAKNKHPAQALRPRQIAADYAPDADRPLLPYAVLTGGYAVAFGGALVALRASGRELPERITVADVALIGVATHKLSRLLARDRIASFLRAPFTRFQGPAGPGEVDEAARGAGMERAVGELLICPYCLAQWVASGLMLGLVAAPRLTRLLSAVMVAHTIADFMQVGYYQATSTLG
ncbi:MAG TPA: DUF1360 domain-containing protein [Solirubrobacteraceae bacterium]|nr:DUF1360 domain-containing protein [Solirubrobacteraceae bacterium]